MPSEVRHVWPAYIPRVAPMPSRQSSRKASPVRHRRRRKRIHLYVVYRIMEGSRGPRSLAWVPRQTCLWPTFQPCLHVDLLLHRVHRWSEPLDSIRAVGLRSNDAHPRLPLSHDPRLDPFLHLPTNVGPRRVEICRSRTEWDAALFLVAHPTPHSVLTLKDDNLD